MAGTMELAPKTPWHLWVVGILSLLWNAMGAVDFTMTQTSSEVWLKGFSPEQQAYFDAIPLWSVIAWGTGTWGSFLGSVLLLLRRGLAVNFFAASLVGLIGSTLYSFVLSEGMKVMGGGAGMIFFHAAIYVILVLLLIYSARMLRCGALR
jgi:hypothetical protein